MATSGHNTVSSNSGLRDNRARGTVAGFLAEKIQGGSQLSIVHTFRRRATGQLLLGRDAILPTHKEQATEDSEFELITWLVIKEAKS